MGRGIYVCCDTCKYQNQDCRREFIKDNAFDLARGESVECKEHCDWWKGHEAALSQVRWLNPSPARQLASARARAVSSLRLLR